MSSYASKARAAIAETVGNNLRSDRVTAEKGGGLSTPAVLTPVPLPYTRSVLDSSPAVAA